MTKREEQREVEREDERERREDRNGGQDTMAGCDWKGDREVEREKSRERREELQREVVGRAREENNNNNSTIGKSEYNEPNIYGPEMDESHGRLFRMNSWDQRNYIGIGSFGEGVRMSDEELDENIGTTTEPPCNNMDGVDNMSSNQPKENWSPNQRRKNQRREKKIFNRNTRSKDSPNEEEKKSEEEMRDDEPKEVLTHTSRVDIPRNISSETTPHRKDEHRKDEHRSGAVMINVSSNINNTGATAPSTHKNSDVPRNTRSEKSDDRIRNKKPLKLKETAIAPLIALVEILLGTEWSEGLQNVWQYLVVVIKCIPHFIALIITVNLFLVFCGDHAWDFLIGITKFGWNFTTGRIRNILWKLFGNYAPVAFVMKNKPRAPTPFEVIDLLRDPYQTIRNYEEGLLQGIVIRRKFSDLFTSIPGISLSLILEALMTSFISIRKIIVNTTRYFLGLIGYILLIGTVCLIMSAKEKLKQLILNNKIFYSMIPHVHIHT